MTRAINNLKSVDHLRRRGALYIAVLGASLIVAMLALGAMHTVRINLKRAQSRAGRSITALIAESAIEHALATIEADPNWRTNYLSGVSYPTTPIALNGGEFTWKLIDSDGNLADNLADSVTVQATAVTGDVEHALEVRLQPADEAPLSSLESAFHCNGNIVNGISVNLTTNSFISSNANINGLAFGASLDGDCEASGSIAVYTTGDIEAGVPPRQMPDESVFDYYLHLGTPIDLAALAHNDHYDLEDVVLSPQSNPWGSPNPEGIYVIDCQGGELRVKQVRIVGTLVLLNPGSGSRIEQEVLFEPAVNNFPSLLVQGSIGIRFDSSSELEESSTNFNPPGTPFDGEEDTDTSDSYPSYIRGLVYVSGNINFIADFNPSLFQGVVLCNTSTCNSDATFNHYPLFEDHPPPGFASGNRMRIIPGSWKRIPTP